MIDLSKSCRTYLKTGVPRVPNVRPTKNNDILICCDDKTRNTCENPTCSTCSAGTPRTPTEHVGVPENACVSTCKFVGKLTRNTKNTKNTKKQVTPTSFQDVQGEPELKPCPLCNGRDFIHGHKGGYFCTTCQQNARPGKLVQAGIILHNQAHRVDH